MATQTQLCGLKGTSHRRQTWQRSSLPEAGLCIQAEGMLRDMAYVLKLTRGLKQEILTERARGAALLS